MIAPPTLAVPLVTGALAGLGVFVAVRSFRPGALAVAVGHIERRPSSPTDRGRTALLRLGQLGSHRRRQDLAVSATTATAHAAAKLGTAAAGAGLVVGVSIASPAVGLSIPSGTVILLCLVGVVAGYLIPDAALKRRASRRRRDFAHALSSYLDLVNVLLAGGAGIETALQAAADAGDGWVFEEIRTVLMRARTTRRSVWSCFSELGESFGVDDLAELSASIQLAGEQGARVAASLAARANAMRDRLLARLEADAQAASERMGLPTVFMFMGFLFLLGFPAVQIILGST